ncbi:MAG: hypothetical protein IPL61_36860 [Myxococcales bacterium]|nr:hypothetical protein [Myxococcales bacterium]
MPVLSTAAAAGCARSTEKRASGRRGLGRRLAPVAPVALAHLRRGPIELRLFTMVTTLGAPLDVTAEELRIESCSPADDASERVPRGWAPV